MSAFGGLKRTSPEDGVMSAVDPKRTKSALKSRSAIFRFEAREKLLVKRREFITLLGGTGVWPLAARAQQPDRVRRVGFLISTAETDQEARAWITAFERRFAELGWVDGRNVRIE